MRLVFDSKNFLSLSFIFMFEYFFYRSVLLSAFSYNIKQSKSKKFQNKMNKAQDQPIEENKDLNLQSLQLSSLFLFTKKITKQLQSIKKISESQDNVQLEKCRKQIAQVLKFIVQKISNKKKLKIDQFIALLSIFVYINVALEAGEKFGIQFSANFYQNVQKYIEKVVMDCSSINIADLKGNSYLNLSILLCSLSSMIEQSGKNICNLIYCKLFSSQNLKQILSLRLPNEEKFIKHYKNLVLYFNKLTFSMGMKKKFIKSLSYSLVNYSDYNNMQLTSIFLLNKCLDDEKFFGKINQIWQKSELDHIVQVCIGFMLNQKQVKPVQMKLVLDFCSKILLKIQKFDQKVINVPNFFKLYHSLNTHMSQPDRLHPCMQGILSKMSSSQQLQILNKVASQQKQKFSIIHLQFLEIASKKMQNRTIITFLESGEWQKILFLFQETCTSINSSIKQSEMPNRQNLNYRRYLLNRIINNILKNCQDNSDICCVLRNLFEIVTGVCQQDF